MKFLIFFTFLAFAVACVLAGCKPGSDNKPQCSADEKVPHGHNANAYWQCEGGEAKKVSCKDQCFNADASACAPCNSFKWKTPCP